jgi:hypothetical protein
MLTGFRVARWRVAALAGQLPLFSLPEAVVVVVVVAGLAWCRPAA